MSNSYLINQIRLSPQSSSRNGVIVDTFLIHHQAGTNDDEVINAMVTGSKQVSANYTISNEGRVTLVVDESLRSWSAGSSTDGGKGAAWDRRSITVEIENEAGAPDWPISQIAKQTAANLLADLKSRYNIKNVLGHRDLWNMYSASYPTFCPGPNTVAEIIKLTPFPTPINNNPITNIRNRGNKMDYGLLKSDADNSIYVIRNIDGAVRPINYIEYAGYLSTGLSLSIVPANQLTEWAANHPWTSGK